MASFGRRPGRARHEISMPMGLQVFHIKVQTGLQLIMIRRIPLVRKPATATKSPAKKPAARTIKAKAAALVAKVKAPAPVVTLKHIAAEIAEAHELPKTHAETMLTDTVDRLDQAPREGQQSPYRRARNFSGEEARSTDGPQSADRGSGEDQGQQEGHLPRRQGIEGGGLTRWWVSRL